MKVSTSLAMDLGAGSGRSILGRFDGERISVEEIHRFPNKPISMLNHYYWNISGLYEEIKTTLSLYSQRFDSQLGSFGIDTWGIDFCLLGKDDLILGLPYSYRDERTNGVMKNAFQKISKEDLHRLTGAHNLRGNTIFQLYSMVLDESPLLEVAKDLLFIPDLFNFLLTGKKFSEFTLATTSQLFNPLTKNWAREIFEKLDIPMIMQKIITPGTVIGEFLPEIRKEVGISSSQVIAPATHDTGSAVAAIPADGENWAFISSGTWSLLGIEVMRPIITEQALIHNFTNEGSVGGKFRFLKDINGLWLLQECKRLWNKKDKDLDFQTIIKAALSSKPFKHLIYPDHSYFLEISDNKCQDIIDFCEKTGQEKPSRIGEISRCIFESLAFRYREVLEKLKQIKPEPIEVLHIVGGGAKNQALNQFTANACGIPVVTGPTEAASIGNIVTQEIGKGHIQSIKEARRIIKKSFKMKVFYPQDFQTWAMAYKTYLKIKKRGEVIGS